MCFRPITQMLGCIRNLNVNSGSGYLKFRRIAVRYMILLFTVLTAESSGQQADSCSEPVPNSARRITILTELDFFTTFTGVNYLNGRTDTERNNLYLYYNITLSNKVKAGNLSINSHYFNEFGLRDYRDSIQVVSEDQYTMKNSAAFRIPGAGISLNAAFVYKSQYFRHFEFRLDSNGKSEKYLYTSYLSPGYRNASVGLRIEPTAYFAVELGIVNGRKTKIRNQQIFETRQASKLYGLSKGTNSITEYGLNLIVTIQPHEILKNLYWENFTQINAAHTSLTRISGYKLDINNAFHYRFLRFFRLSLRTFCLYDSVISPKVTLATNLSLGFYLSNTF